MTTRKNIRLQDHDYSRNGAYFVTICTKDRQHFFWNYNKPVGGDAHIAPPVSDISTPVPFELTNIGRIVEKYIVNIPGIQKYVIMPDHVHILIQITGGTSCCEGAMWASPPTKRSVPTQSLSQLIRSFKILVTKEIGFSPWQRSFYDHIIRSAKDHSQIWQYIENNPINWENNDHYQKEK